MTLCIISYNCFSIRKRVETIKQMLLKADILICQEIILLENDCQMLLNFNADFNVHYVPSSPPTSQHGDGRPVGGSAVFYRKELHVSTTLSTSNFQAMKVGCSEDSFLLVNTYMPTDYRDDESLSRYQCVLGELQSLLDNINIGKILIMGDLNADPIRKSKFWPSLKIFVEDNDLNINDLSLPTTTFTYLNTAYNTTSWIDHVISSKSLKIPEVSVRYDWALYDHFPILISLEHAPQSNLSFMTTRSNDDLNSNVDWEKLQKTEYKNCYNQMIIRDMMNVGICLNVGCTHDHRRSLDLFLLKLVTSLKKSGSQVAQRTKSKNFRIVPGWNQFCKEKYETAREAFFKWMEHEKIGSGPIYEPMKSGSIIFQKF